MPRKFIIDFKRAPGDVLLMSGLVRDLRLTYGKQYQLDVRTQFPAIWRHNPYLTKMGQADAGVKFLQFGGLENAVDREGLIASQKGLRQHYLMAFYRRFAKDTGIEVPCLFPHADLTLSDQEKAQPYIDGRYWVIIPGGKTDMTTKFWLTQRYQEVVTRLRPDGFQFVQEGATKPMHVHPKLSGVLPMIGKTSVRDLIVNIYHAEGVICGVTFPMHIAAALGKPCVVLMGGREEPWYEEYSDAWNAFDENTAKVKVPHHMLHTFGEFDCCRHRGCWKRRLEKLNDGRPKYDESLCLRPVRRPGDQIDPIVSECMSQITTDQVIAAVKSYYEDGTLPPLPKPTRTKAQPITNDMVFAPPTAPLPVLLRNTEKMGTDGKNQIPESQPQQTVKPKAPAVHPQKGSLGILDHPAIGGKVTICALLYGDHAKMHRRCLRSIAEHVPPSRMELRVATNQTGLETQNLLNGFPIAKTYPDIKGRRKCQAMRDMFHDKEAPIVTPWIVWFDDVACVRHPKWLSILAETIINQDATAHVGLLGDKQKHILQVKHGKDPRKWFQQGSWWKHKLFQNRLGAASPNGDVVHFVSPNWFAISKQAVTDCDIPDARLLQSGLGVCIGEQLNQGGYKIKQFNTDQKYVLELPDKRNTPKTKYPWH